jgi:hypothetical protein
MCIIGVLNLGGFYYSEVTDPNSIKPNPRSNSESIAIPLVSKPALNPIGLLKVYPLLVFTLN